MFLSGLKEKSIIRRLKATSSVRQFLSTSGKITSVALLQNDTRPFGVDELRSLIKMLGIPEAQMTVINYIATPDKVQLLDERVVADKHLGWNGVLKPIHLKNFTEKTFDVLISYYDEENLPLLTLSAQSAAAFKVGIGRNFFDIQDLSIQVDLGREATFSKELEKYLNILKIKK